MWQAQTVCHKDKESPVSSPTNALQVCERDSSATMLAAKRSAGEGMCNVTCTPLLSLNKVEPTLALKPR